MPLTDLGVLFSGKGNTAFSFIVCFQLCGNCMRKAHIQLSWLDIHKHLTVLYMCICFCKVSFTTLLSTQRSSHYKLYRFAEMFVNHLLFLFAPPETKPGNGLCKTGNIALFGNVVYSGLLNDHFWHFGVPLVTRLVSNFLLSAFIIDPHPCHIQLHLWFGPCRRLGHV